jgi:hypothetical protein
MLGRDRGYLYCSAATVFVFAYQNLFWRRTLDDASKRRLRSAGVDRLYRCADSIPDLLRSVLIHWRNCDSTGRGTQLAYDGAVYCPSTMEMHMLKHGKYASALSKAVAVTAMAFVASSAHALLFNGSYTVTSNSSSSAGLAVGTLNDFGSAVTATTNSFTGLNVTTGGAVHFTDLFEIFAVDSPPYTGNDLIPQAITVGFTFSSPSAASGTLTGTTVGTISGTGLAHFAKPIDLTFNGQSILEITLSDAQFADSFNGVVEAQFRSFVPEPGTLALLGIGLVGAFALRPRTTARAEAAVAITC